MSDYPLPYTFRLVKLWTSLYVTSSERRKVVERVCMRERVLNVGKWATGLLAATAASAAYDHMALNDENFNI